MMKPSLQRAVAFGMAVILCSALMAVGHAQPRAISGIYPHLAMSNDEDECGTGAVVPWADRLWVITYAPHKPSGSTDKLYEVTPGLEQTVRPESIGGTPANRLIHRESKQLFIGPYVVGADRTVSVIPYSKMFGRPTGTARHLEEGSNKVVTATMEEGFYEVDVKSLAVTELWADEQRKEGRKANLPGYHGKGFYSAQGRYVYANNGDHSPEARTNPAAPSGALASWAGKADGWDIVRRNQFTEVTGPGGIEGNQPEDDRLWSIGWDHRSLILMLLEDGKWTAYRLPKASHAYDGGHGWNTEWPRIREIGEEAFLMTMHGSFWKFPRTFSTANSAGIAPRSTYLKVIGDFCRWENRIVFGCDDTARSEFLNKHPLKGKLAGPGKSQSNLWFVKPSLLDQLGPPLGRGAVWVKDDVKAGVPSEPFLFSGFAKRSMVVAHGNSRPVIFDLEVDVRGNGRWTKLREVFVPAYESVWTEFPEAESGTWLRLIARRDAPGATAFFHYRGEDKRAQGATKIFDGVATPRDSNVSGGLLHVGGGEPSMLRFVARNDAGELGGYVLDAGLHLRKSQDPGAMMWVTTNAAIPSPTISADEASVVYVDDRGRRWRLPRNPTFDRPGVLGPERVCREVSTERNLLNTHGTFYEMPAENAGGFAKLRPIATHNRRITDFASYRGLLVLSGVQDRARGEHIIASDDGKCRLWVGAVDDLWQFGKPRGQGGPWKTTAVLAHAPSDAYLLTGYDRKRLTLSHSGSESVRMRIEVDTSGSGDWMTYRVFEIAPGKTMKHQFPDGFGAYWLRVTADKDTVATAQLTYD